MASETRYDLKSPFSFALDGDTTQATHILLREPTWSNMADVGKLRKWINNALQQNRADLEEAGSEALEQAEAAAAEPDTDDESEDEEEFIDPSAIIALLARADIPLDKLYVVAVKIMESEGISRIASLDGAKPMKPTHWKKISALDAESMVGHYISAFFLR